MKHIEKDRTAGNMPIYMFSTNLYSVNTDRRTMIVIESVLTRYTLSLRLPVRVFLGVLNLTVQVFITFTEIVKVSPASLPHHLGTGGAAATDTGGDSTWTS